MNDSTERISKNDVNHSNNNKRQSTSKKENHRPISPIFHMKKDAKSFKKTVGDRKNKRKAGSSKDRKRNL